MDDKKENEINFDNLSVDKNVLENFCSNSNIKNLIYLSSQMELNPFNKKNKKWQLKSKDKFIKECEQVKKKELKEFSTALANLAKLGCNNTIDVKNIYKNFECKLENLDKIITCANHIETSEKTNGKNKTTYLVDHEPYSQSNVVSFDIIGEKQDLNQKPNIIENTPAVKINKPQNKQKIKENIVEIKVINNIKSPTESSINGDYLECYGNC